MNNVSMSEPVKLNYHAVPEGVEGASCSMHGNEYAIELTGYFLPQKTLPDLNVLVEKDCNGEYPMDFIAACAANDSDFTASLHDVGIDVRVRKVEIDDKVRQ